jgi:hypothetical protein
MSFFTEITEEKTRVTHKFGYEPVKYKVKLTGLLANIEKNDLWPFVFMIITLSYLIIFYIGLFIGPNISDKEKKKKIEEFKELQKLSNESIVDNNSSEDIPPK